MAMALPLTGPQTCESRAAGQESPHFTDGETEARDSPASREAGKYSLRAQASSWVAWPHPGYGTSAGH